MKKLIFSLIVLASLPAGAQQQNGGLSISLQQAIETGLKNRYDIQAKKYDLLIASDRVTKNKKEWIPDISAVGNVRYSPQLQATYIPPGFFGPEPGLVALGAKATSVFGLDLNQTIFKPSIGLNVKVAKNNLEIEKEKVRADENRIKEQIALAYLNVVLKDLQWKIADANEQRNKEYAEVAKGKLNMGTLVENDYLKAKLDQENAKTEALKAKQNYELALENLKYQINVPQETVLALTDSIDSQNFSPDKFAAKGDAANRTEIKQLNLRQVANQLEIRRSRQNALPTVSFYANYSQQYMYDRFDLSESQWWSPFSYVGLRMSVPITGNFKTADNTKEFRSRAMQSDFDLKQKTADIDYEIQKTSAELANAKENMQSAKSNYDLSKVVYANQKEQYTMGTLLYSSLLDTERSLNTTEQNYIRSVYDYLLSNINYQKAIGNY